jgi:hypothetical protein
LHHLDFVHMQPNNALAKADLPPGATLRVLAKPGKDYLVYLRTGLGRTEDVPEPKTQCEQGELSIELTLPLGEFAAQWLDTKACHSLEPTRFVHTSGSHTFAVPAFIDDIALLLRAD